MKRITQKISFGVMASFAALSALMLPSTSFAATTWQATAPAQIAFMCDGVYNHTINTINQAPDGTLTGTGTWDADHSYTWNLTGAVSGDTVAFSVTYTGAVPGLYHLSGTIAPDGSVSGNVDSNCQKFTMPAGSFIHPLPPEPTSPSTKDDCKKGGWEGYHFKNQGQCVRFIETGKDSR